MGETFELVMESDGCCEQLSCAPLETGFLCPVCRSTWEDGTGNSEAHEMLGQPPGSFLAYHKRSGTEPRFTCSKCGQLFRLRAAKRLPTDAGQDHKCKIEAIDTVIPTDGTIYRNGDREHWIGFSTTTDVTGAVLVVRKFSYKGEKRTDRKFESLSVIYPWLLDKMLSVATALDAPMKAGDAQ